MQLLGGVGDADAGPGHDQAQQLDLGAAQLRGDLRAQTAPEEPLDADERVGQLVREGFRFHTQQIISVAEVMNPKDGQAPDEGRGGAPFILFVLKFPIWAFARRASDRRHVRGSGRAGPGCPPPGPRPALPRCLSVPQHRRREVRDHACHQRQSEAPPARRRPRHRRRLPHDSPRLPDGRARGAAATSWSGPGCRWPSGSPAGSGAAARPWRTCYQVAALGLVKAVDHYDPARGNAFESVRRADHHRRDQAALPRPHVDAARAAPGPGPAQPGAAAAQGAVPDDPGPCAHRRARSPSTRR